MPEDLDQFYTKSSIVRSCIDDLVSQFGQLTQWKTIIEPSAGSGNFLKELPRHAIGLDLDPRDPLIQKADYLNWNFPNDQGPSLVIGNPPFGKNSTLAIKFFNKSAAHADVIAFIVPRTFRKSSVVNRLDRRFHLVHEKILPIDSFHTPGGDNRSVPTCFQIWKKLDILRKNSERRTQTHDDWTWVASSAFATHAIRRVGCYAGKIIPLDQASPASHFFIRANIDNFDVKWDFVWNEFWKEEKTVNAKWDVAGNPSLTKEEIVYYYTVSMKKIVHNNSTNGMI